MVDSFDLVRFQVFMTALLKRAALCVVPIVIRALIMEAAGPLRQHNDSENSHLHACRCEITKFTVMLRCLAFIFKEKKMRRLT